MMIRKTITTLLLIVYVSTFAQDVTLEEISNNIKQIETDTTFTLTEQNQLKQIKTTLDGGYLLKIWHKGRKISKIVEDIGLSYGSIQTTVYLTNHTPIKIIESEDIFAETPTGLNYKKLNNAYKVTHDILNWEHKKIITKEAGTRVFNTPKKAILDYNLLIDSAKKTIDE
ncbi:hypothetical protein [uncultured Tenacibaculum sp.]|uniref:hypothetical protein n=1 Tax=uncultured Tenacibaculum sp. TaxID=174713 RepID=UPI00261A8295|nr:hypothetical protein [uncultured Tenacibaculum sp.]